MKDWTGNKAHGSTTPKKASSKGATGGKKSKSKGGSAPTTKSANKQY
jgi:hypothetical protein